MARAVEWLKTEFIRKSTIATKETFILDCQFGSAIHTARTMRPEPREVTAAEKWRRSSAFCMIASPTEQKIARPVATPTKIAAIWACITATVGEKIGRASW